MDERIEEKIKLHLKVLFLKDKQSRDETDSVWNALYQQEIDILYDIISTFKV